MSVILFSQEKNGVLDGLKAKAELVSGTYNAIEGITCNPIQGAMYCFPRLHLPQKAVQHAKVGSQSHLATCYSTGIVSV